MQCKGTMRAPVTPPASAFGSEFGIDFAFGGPSGATAKRAGAHFGASYLSDSSKDWTAGNLASYRAAGLPVVFVWETAATRSLDGWNAGYDDAFDATHEAARLGYGQKGLHIDFASDYDTNGYGCAFCQYYEGAAAWDKRVGDTTGAYGGVATVWTLCDHGITTENWQTVAWSGDPSQWVSPSCAPLRQTGINDFIFDYPSMIDNDRAVAANYGQWPVPVTKLICFGRGAQTTNATCKKAIKAEKSAVKAADSSLRAYVARGCNVLAQRVSWFAAKIKEQPKSIKLESRKRALRASEKAYANRSCLVFAQRVGLFDSLAKQLKEKY